MALLKPRGHLISALMRINLDKHTPSVPYKIRATGTLTQNLSAMETLDNRLLTGTLSRPCDDPAQPWHHNDIPFTPESYLVDLESYLVGLESYAQTPGNIENTAFSTPANAAATNLTSPLSEYVSPRALLGQDELANMETEQSVPSHGTKKPSADPPRSKCQLGRPRQGNNPGPSRSATSRETEQGTDSSKYDHDDGKGRIRARNRKAAANFRVRNKQSVGKLQEREASGREINRVLSDEASQLWDESLRLKSMVLEHAGCQCPRIDAYIQHAASNLA